MGHLKVKHIKNEYSTLSEKAETAFPQIQVKQVYFPARSDCSKEAEKVVMVEAISSKSSVFDFEQLKMSSEYDAASQQQLCVAPSAA